MSSKSKPARVSSVTRKRAVKSPSKRTRRATTTFEVWEQTAQVPDERDDDFDCQRIVQGDGSRSLPLYYDDYN